MLVKKRSHMRIGDYFPGRKILGWSILTMIVGVGLALLVTYIFNYLSNTYATFLVAAIMLPFILFFVGNTKFLLLGFLTLCLPISIDVTVGRIAHLGGSPGYIISIFDIILAVLYFLWFLEIARNKSIRVRFYPKISIPAILLIGIAVVSAAFARRPELSMFEIIEILKMYLCFLYIANNVKTESDLHFIITFLIIGLFLEGVLGFGQRRFGEPIWPTSLGGPSRIDDRITGTWTSYNDFAWYLTFILPLAFSLLFSNVNKYYKYLCGIITVFGTASLMWSNSRSGWISFALAVLFIFAFAFGKIRGKWAFLKAVTSILLITVLFTPLYPRLYNKVLSRFGGDDRGSAESRLPQFEVAFKIIEDNYLIGVGINNYTAIMKDYDTTLEGLESITSYAVHNIYLHIAAEIGIFGLFVYFVLLTVIFMEGIRRSIIMDKYVSYVIIGLLGGIIAFLVHGLADTAPLGSKMYMFLWYFTGIIFSAQHIVE